MAETIYSYSILTDVTSGKVANGQLESEIFSSDITIAVNRVDSLGDALSIVMKDAISADEKTILDGVVLAHVIAPPASDPKDSQGYPIITTKKIPDGYYPEFREIEFETAKLDSIHDKNYLGADLGMSSVTFLDASRVEMITPTQDELIASCKYTCLKFAPGDDWGIRASNIRQLALPVGILYVWVNLKILVDPSPVYISLPYANGGLNMEFQNMRESIGVGDENYSFFTGNDSLEWLFEHGIGEQHRFRIVYEAAFKIGV